MPRTDKSTTILTGMIIAALYVILLVGFTQDSYRWREFSMRRGAASRTDDVSRPPVAQDGSRQVCTADLPLCATLFPDSDERQSCLASIDAVRRFVSEPLAPLTMDRIRRAMGEEP